MQKWEKLIHSVEYLKQPFKYSLIFFICYWLNSSQKLCQHSNSLLSSIIEIQSTSIVERTTIFCNFETQLIVLPPTMFTYQAVLFLLSLSLAISTSAQTYRPKFDFLKYKVGSMIPCKYLRILFTASQCCFLKLLISLLATPTTCAISSLIHIIAYTRLLIAKT